MGYILNGEYHRGEAPVDKMRTKQQSTYKSWEHNRQRKDFAREIVQPYDKNGKPNNDFIQAWPEDSKEVYGFLPSDEDLKNK